MPFHKYRCHTCVCFMLVKNKLRSLTENHMTNVKLESNNVCLMCVCVCVCTTCTYVQQWTDCVYGWMSRTYVHSTRPWRSDMRQTWLLYQGCSGNESCIVHTTFHIFNHNRSNCDWNAERRSISFPPEKFMYFAIFVARYLR